MSRSRVFFCLLFLSATAFFTGCGAKPKVDEAAAAPPDTKVVTVADVNDVQVSHPEQFPLATAGSKEQLPEINVTGTVNPDISQEIPVVSLASGRVVEIRARLGDSVAKGQLLLRVLSQDISQAFADYNKAKADEELARKQMERLKLLYDHGAVAFSEYEISQETEQKAKVDLDNTAQHIRTIGADVSHQEAVVNIYAPVSGTIVDQQVTRDANVKTPDNQATGLFTIADLSHVWIVCDVFENDLPIVRVGDTADVRLNAYPDRTFHGRISNIGQILDPAIRTAKVRIQLANPGIMRVGMFANATFYGQHGQTYATVPPSSILHLHDRDWVYLPAGGSKFRRTNVTSGKLIDPHSQMVVAGLAPGQQVVSNALALSSESEQQ